MTILHKLSTITTTIIIIITNTIITTKCHSNLKQTPPLPVLPLPSYSQLKWQQRELIMFFHLGVNTFTDSEWGTGAESPSIFDPSGLDARQWVSAAEAAGASLAILTAKHHDGFCLWPSEYTSHSVASSPWKSGAGDVVKDLVEAAKGIVDVGLYLSPWDRHDRRYGRELDYNEYYLAQLQELLTKYGSDIKEIWFDGAKGKNAKNMTYYFSEWFSMAKEFQSSINIFSDAGPDVRWVGDENGFAGSTCWSTINRTSLAIGKAGIEGYLQTGEANGRDWLPAECDVSIRPGWFWHKSQSPKNLTQLLEIYYNSVGRNCVLLLNVPPNTTGLISEEDVEILKQFRGAINKIFSTNLADKCSIKASSVRGGKESGFGPQNVIDNDHLWTYWAPKDSDSKDHWIEIRGPKDGGLRFNVVRIQEAIGLGQRVKRHEVYLDGKKIVANGTTIGYKRLHRLEDGIVFGRVVRIKIVESRALPLISSIGLYYDPFWHPVI